MPQPRGLDFGIEEVLRTALTMAAAAVAHAQELGVAISCSIVDTSGTELVTIRMDHAPWFTPGVARAKAKSSAAMASSTADLADLKSEYPELITLIDGQVGFSLTTLGGGIPVAVDGVPVAGIGVSGAHPSQDIACAEAAVRAASSS